MIGSSDRARKVYRVVSRHASVGMVAARCRISMNDVATIFMSLKKAGRRGQLSNRQRRRERYVDQRYASAATAPTAGDAALLTAA